MNKTKIILASVLVLLVLLLAAAIGGIWFVTTHVIVAGEAYSTDLHELDLRGTEISAEDFEQVHLRMPDARIHWDVPFQGGYYAENTKNLTITALTQEDVATLDYFEDLESVSAEGCTDYAQIAALVKRRPEVAVSYTVDVGGESLSQAATQLSVSGITEKELELLQYLPELTDVVVEGNETPEQLTKLQALCGERGISFSVKIADKLYADTTQELTISGITDGDLELLRYLPELSKLHLVNPEAAAENVVQLREAYPNAAITWEQEVAGLSFPDDAVEIDISALWPETVTTTTAAWGVQETQPPVTVDLKGLKAAMAYFPDAQMLYLGLCGLDNEELAAFREEAREDYKVVWKVTLGKKLTARTDDTSFMPVRENVYYFLDSEAYNLRYCEEMICIDIGHMAVSDVSFVAFMPHLKYLILAHTQVQDISALENCKELLFLELDWSPVRDFTPLLGCTALEDLNVGNTFADMEPIKQMTWLKHLWMNGRSGSAYMMVEALPDVTIMYAGDATVAGGWRELQNYFDMRDALGMEYMTW